MSFPIDLSDMLPRTPGEAVSRRLSTTRGAFLVTVRMEAESVFTVRITSESGVLVDQTQRPVPRDVAEFWYRDFCVEYMGDNR